VATDRQRQNLRRGGIQGTAESAARAREAKARAKAGDDRLRAIAVTNPRAASLELHADLVLGVRKLTRMWLRSGSDPSRQLVEAWRELRMLTDRVLEYLREQGSEDGAGEFFSTLDERLSSLVEHTRCHQCGAAFDLDVRPAVEPSTGDSSGRHR
jgi:hypothetical protein